MEVGGRGGDRGRGAADGGRNSNCHMLGGGGQRHAATVSCDPWTIHSIIFNVPGMFVDPFVAAWGEVGLNPLVFGRRLVDRETGQVLPWPRRVRLDFVRPGEPGLVLLGIVAEVFSHIDWRRFPGIAVNRLDLASDHLLSVDPHLVRDQIAEVKLPYSRMWRGQEADGQLWETVYHQGGRAEASSVVVAHYPRLDALLHRCPDAGPEAVEYTRWRLRQEVRIRADALRRLLGGGSVTVQAVLGSLPVFIGFAERRLAPIFRAGVLSPPIRSIPGEEALARAVRPIGHHGRMRT
jgi:hypothetical protein